MPELWHPDTGRTTVVSYRIDKGRIIISFDLTAGEAVFVVFRKPATANAATVLAPVGSTVVRIDGPWVVTFQPGRYAPAKLRLPTLALL